MSASAYGPLTVIANPHAGGGSVADRLPLLERELERHDLPHRLRVLERREDAAAVARESLAAGGRFLVSVGGDGTLQTLLGGVFDDGRAVAEEVVIGVVPAGARCDLLRSFGLPGDVEGAVAHLVGENVYPFDVAKVTCAGDGDERITRYCHNVAVAGFGAAVARRVRRLPPWAGRLRPFLGFWIELARARRPRVTVAADARSYEGPAYEVVIANGQFAGGDLYGDRGVRLSPRSFPGDGVLDALVFTGPRSDAYRMLPRIYRHGDHVPDPHIRELRARIRIGLDAERPLPIVADGEPLGWTPATFQVLSGQILLKL
jgi:diacylglycerol kinase family enzyme